TPDVVCSVRIRVVHEQRIQVHAVGQRADTADVAVIVVYSAEVLHLRCGRSPDNRVVYMHGAAAADVQRAAGRAAGGIVCEGAIPQGRGAGIAGYDTAAGGSGGVACKNGVDGRKAAVGRVHVHYTAVAVCRIFAENAVFNIDHAARGKAAVVAAQRTTRSCRV